MILIVYSVNCNRYGKVKRLYDKVLDSACACVCACACVYYRPVVLAAFSTDTIPNQ